ncbi:cysteine-rich KTR domain-containing protein [[Ruminococcus] lactaris]|uniref:cysteine-rich KTR domain-containing protein n=1 Tax=[Ruminococcus] lactaris TaxID=46228 RepID=UPI0026DCF157|nr:cysteine-rich KTR domain-containing protein [[Ruminococcus] lactaris]
MIVNGWYYCPAGHKTGQRVEKNSNIENAPIWCKHCKKAYYPVIKDGKIHGKEET